MALSNLSNIVECKIDAMIKFTLGGSVVSKLFILQMMLEAKFQHIIDETLPKDRNNGSMIKD